MSSCVGGASADTAYSAIYGDMPCRTRRLTRPGLASAEADAALAREALDVDDLCDGERVGAVVRVERDARAAAPAERELEPVDRLGVDERVHHVAAREPDLDADPVVSHSTRAPRGRRGRRWDGRTPPVDRTGRGGAGRRSAPLPAARGGPAPPAGRPPRRRRGAFRGRGWRGTSRRASRRRATRAVQRVRR